MALNIKPVPMLPAIMTKLKNRDWQEGVAFSQWLDSVKPASTWKSGGLLEMERGYWFDLAFPWTVEGWTDSQRETAIHYEAGKQQREQDSARRELTRYLADFRIMAQAVGEWLGSFSRSLKPEGRARVMASDLAALVKAARKAMPTKTRRKEACKTYTRAGNFWDAMFDRIQLSTVDGQLVAHQWVIDDEGEMAPVGTIAPRAPAWEDAPLCASVELTALYEWLRVRSEDSQYALTLRLSRAGTLVIETDPALRLRSRLRLPHNASYLIEL